MLKEFNQSLAPWIGKTMKMLDNKVDGILEEKNIDLSKTQFLILQKAFINEGVCQNELAFFANRNKSSLTRMINTLEKKNYIARIPSKEDKRINKLFITKEGKNILEEVRPLFVEIIQLVEKGLSEEEIESTIKVLMKIQKNIGGADQGPMIKI